MIPLLEFKRLLGNCGKNLTDEEIEEIMCEQYKVTEMAIKVWIREKGLNRIKDAPRMSYNYNTNE